MSTSVRIFFLLLSVILGNCLLAQAADVPKYVSPFGNDGNTPYGSGDGSETSPWRTITYALAHMGGSATVLVMGDLGPNAYKTIDYTENVDVASSVTIAAYDSNAPMPWIQALNTSDHVFEVTADSVTIRGLRATGAEGSGRAGVYLGDVETCVIEDNELGVSAMDYWGHNTYGVYMDHGYGHVIRNNLCNHEDTQCSMYVSNGEGMVFHGNELNSGSYGIVLGSGSKENTITGNQICYMTEFCLLLEGSTQWNAISSNYIHHNTKGILLSFIEDDIVADCTIVNNGSGVFRISLTTDEYMRFFLSKLAGNTQNVNVSTYPCTAHSPSLLRYAFNSQYFYSELGNYYDDNDITDANFDGIDDAPYTATNYTDNYPLAADPETANYAFGGYTLESTPSIANRGWLREGQYGIQGAAMDLPDDGSLVFRCEAAASRPKIFAGGNQMGQSTWHGWLTFTSPPASGYSVNLDFGVSDADGNNFEALGPRAVITGDGAAQRLDFVAPDEAFTVPGGSCLAMRVSNPGVDDLGLHVGGVMALIVPPEDTRYGGLVFGTIMNLLN